MEKLSLSAFESKYKLDIRSSNSMYINMIFNPKYNYQIDYDIKLSNGKNLQRDFVWTIFQKRELIKSILKGIEIPNFAFVIYEHYLLRVVDGKQRLKAIEEFYNGKFGIIVDDIEYFIDDLDDNAKSRIITTTINVNPIYEYSDTKLSDNQLIAWFEMINFAGTPQDIEHIKNLQL